MGLDIWYATRIRRVDDDADERFDWDGLSLYVPDYDEHASRADGLTTGCYEADWVDGFRAGSYGGYNRWRERLSMLALDVMPRIVWAQPDEFRGRPFYEIINFSDAEGVIGSATSAKLATDFDAFAERAAECFDEHELRVYEDFRRAFHAAADGGAVQFA